MLVDNRRGGQRKVPASLWPPNAAVQANKARCGILPWRLTYVRPGPGFARSADNGLRKY